MLSIITVVLNDVEGIKRTYESLSSSLKIPFEWVVVDGKSTDGTCEYLKSLTPAFEFHYISEKDTGLYDAMNKGIKTATKDYLLFLNAGDYIKKGNDLTEISSEKDILVYNIETVDPDLNPSNYRGFRTSTDYLKRSPSIPHQSTLIHKRVFERIGNYDLEFRILADYDFFCKAKSNNCSFEFFPKKILSIFVQDGVSNQLGNITKLKKESIRIQKKYFGKVSVSWLLELTAKQIISTLPKGEKLIVFMRNFLFKNA